MRTLSRLALASAGQLPAYSLVFAQYDGSDDAAGCAACGACGAGIGVIIFIFLAILAINIAILVWVARDAKARGMDSSVLWMILAGMGVFDQVNGLVGQIIQDGENTFDIMDFLGFGRVVSLAIVVGVIDVILMTALATLAAFLYNVSSSLVGGLQLTLTDD
mgnify:CR=1 FL=1